MTKESTNLAYIAGFLDGDGSIFFQIIPEKSNKFKFRIRSSIAFYQKQNYSWILKWLKDYFGGGYIRTRKTGISDYTIVDSKEVYRILKLLEPYVKLKSSQLKLGLQILDFLKRINSNEEFLEICKLVDKFGDLNYSKKRTITYNTVKNSYLPL